MKRTVLKCNTLLVAILSVMIMGIITGCEKEKVSPNTITGNGNIVSRERAARDFYGIISDGAADVNIQPSGDFKVVVTTDNNIQDIILVEVKNNMLHIGQKPNTSFRSTKLIVDVHLPELKSIDLRGSGNIKLSDGNASGLGISLSGAGNIDAENYQVQNVTVTLSGAGNVRIWATDSLNGTLSGAGDILYKGNPAVDVKVTGVGQVKRL
jgi:hypothetical protein